MSRYLSLIVACVMGASAGVGSGVMLASCTASKTLVVESGHAVLHCAKLDQVRLATLGIELGAAAVRMAAGGTVDWAALGRQAETAGLELGSCAYAALRAGVAGGATSVARAPNDASWAALEAMRAKLDGAVIRTSAGDL